MNYKIGSRGEGVEMIQRAIGAEPVDGIFGGGTEAILKIWQRDHGLTADGIAGAATLRKIAGVDITKGYINQHITFSVGRPLKYIAIHYTAGSNSRRGDALSARNVFLTRQASADFVVDDATILQVNPDIQNYYCWAVGDKKNPYTGGGSLYGKATNRNTISIEICSTRAIGTSAAVPNHEGWSFSEKSEENACRLTRYLMMLYGIPKERVVRHYDVSGKLCPGIIGWNDGGIYTTAGKTKSGKSDSEKWEAFIASLK